jgi:hypothetical protein
VLSDDLKKEMHLFIKKYLEQFIKDHAKSENA